MRKKSIAVCCGTPLISTFMFRGSEWYCRKCRRDYPLFNVDFTEKLDREAGVNIAWFKSIAKDCIPISSRRSDCEKCNSEDHWNHATDEQKERSEAAYAKLRDDDE